MAGSDVHGTVWVVVTLSTPQYAKGRVTDLEVLSDPPDWDLAAEGQVCYQASVNGGDSVRWSQQQEPPISAKPAPARTPEYISAAVLLERVSAFDADDLAGFLWALRGGHRAVGGGYTAWAVGRDEYVWMEQAGA